MKVKYFQCDSCFYGPGLPFTVDQDGASIHVKTFPTHAWNIVICDDLDLNPISYQLAFAKMVTQQSLGAL